MLEKETERILKIVLEQTIGKGEAVNVKDILAAEIPYPVKVFFRADVERTLNEELRRSRLKTRFNYHHREVESLQRQMNSVLVLNYMFVREEFLQKMEDGVHLVLNYLLRPQWTLTNFLFNSSPSVTVTELKQMISYFGAYEYVKEVLCRYLEDKNVETVAVTEFQHLIARIDAEYIRRKSGMEIARLATPIYDFIHFLPFSTVRGTHSIPLPVKTLVKFFEDKRLTVIVRSLEQRQEMQAITMEQLQSVLDEICQSNPAAIQPEGILPLPETPLKVTIQSTPPPEEEPLESPAPQEEHELPDLHDLISADDHKRFLKKIFKKDDAHYAAALQELNAMTSWKDASLYVDKILIANDVNPYSNEAIRFSEVVYQRFFPKTPRR